MRGYIVVAGLVFLSAVMSGHRDRFSTPIVVGLIGLAVLFLMRKFRKAGDRQDQFFASLDTHVGAKRDHEWYTFERLQRSFLLTWIPQRKFYFAPANFSFAPTDVYGNDDIRGWTIEKATKRNGRRLFDVYSVNIAVKRTDKALLKFNCGENEALAYQVNEVLAQMFGERA